MGPALLAMAVAEYENFKLALISFRVTSLETVKLSKKSKTRIREAFAVVILKHLQGQKDDITIESNVTRCGNGAFKDVFMFDNCNLVLKMMTKEKNEASWPGNAKQEQEQFNLYRDTASSLMMTCLGQVYVDIAATSPASDICSKGCLLEGDEATSNGIASITVAEKLFQTGTTKLRSTCMTLPCTRHTWHVLADDYMAMVRLIFKFFHLGIVPWDCKLDNVGLASPRREGEAPEWVFCDLDGLRDVREYPNLGSQLKKIVRNMLGVDAGKVAEFQLTGAQSRWLAPFRRMQTLIQDHLITDAMGRSNWTCLGNDECFCFFARRNHFK